MHRPKLNSVVVVVVVVILMAFLVNLYPLRQLLYGYPILLYGVMLSIACACLLKWEETGVPGGNPRKHGENMQTPHRKAQAGPETNPGPSCCEATALTTAPPCRPLELCCYGRCFYTAMHHCTHTHTVQYYTRDLNKARMYTAGTIQWESSLLSYVIQTIKTTCTRSELFTKLPFRL